jgi:hypothetical protein
VRVFENRALRKIFVPMREEATRGGTKFHNLHDWVFRYNEGGREE